jgi:hypothetical protein
MVKRVDFQKKKVTYLFTSYSCLLGTVAWTGVARSWDDGSAGWMQMSLICRTVLLLGLQLIVWGLETPDVTQRRTIIIERWSDSSDCE